MTKYYVLICLLFWAGCRSTRPVASTTEQGYAELTETYWRLTEINHKPAPVTTDNQPEIHIKLRIQAKSLQGFTGCNRLNGIYKVMGSNIVQFQNLSNNSQSCSQTTIENEIITTLGKVNRYKILETKLFLSNHSQSPILCFEAVYF